MVHIHLTRYTNGTICSLLIHIFEELIKRCNPTGKRCNPTGAISLLCIFDFEFDLTCYKLSAGPLCECKPITTSELRCYYPIRSLGYFEKLKERPYSAIFGATVSGLLQGAADCRCIRFVTCILCSKICMAPLLK